MASLVSNGSIAGGTATMLEVLRRTVAAGVPLGDALRSATVVPARVLGLATRTALDAAELPLALRQATGEWLLRLYPSEYLLRRVPGTDHVSVFG